MCNMRSIFLDSVHFVSLTVAASYAVVAVSPGTRTLQPESAVARQMVDRRHKADRLMRVKDAVRRRLSLVKCDIERQTPARDPRQPLILDGCHPALSPLSEPAAISNPRRWLADNTTMETPKPMA